MKTWIFVFKVESANQQLGSVAKSVNSNMAQVVSAAAQGNESYTALAARDTANSLKDFMVAVRLVAATTHKETQHRMIINTQEVLERSIILIEEAKRTLHEPSNLDTLTQAAKRVTQVNYIFWCSL